MKATEEKYVYTVPEAKQILGIGLRQTYRLIEENRFPHKKLGKTIIIPKQGFDEWLSNGNTYNMYSRFF